MNMQTERFAEFSACRTWRYTLDRHWNGFFSRRTVLFILLNPSTADEYQDDPTNRRGIKFSQRWGYNSCVFVNLFAVRTPSPIEMMRSQEPVGPDNDEWIRRRAREADKIVCAWGVDGTFLGRSRQVRKLLAEYETFHVGLKLTKSGEPRHILYLRADEPLVRNE